jgi:adenosylhomocysteinase
MSEVRVVGGNVGLPALGMADSVSGPSMREFFARLAVPAAPSPVKAIVVTHLVHGRGLFLEAVNRNTEIALVIAKPKSVHPPTRTRLEQEYNLCSLRRDVLHAPGYSVDLVGRLIGEDPFVVLDVGGYFAPVVCDLHERFGGQLVGIVEDTENGLQRYQRLESIPVPVVSVARSPLKVPEDHLVGQSIVFSMESILRDQGVVFGGKAATVIGYGKVGVAVAQMFRARGLSTRVFDRNPIRLTEAIASGFEVAATLPEALAPAGLVVCATGNRSLQGGDFRQIRNNAFVAAATSADDEFDLSELRRHYRRCRLDNYVTRYSIPGHRFHMLNKGNPINFLHGTVAGTFIALVQGEILIALRQLLAGQMHPGLQEVSEAERRRIASAWLELFN